jgi:hypothetical protein
LPYRLAQRFAQKTIAEVPHVALLVCSNFDIEGVRRMAFAKNIRQRECDDRPGCRR